MKALIVCGANAEILQGIDLGLDYGFTLAVSSKQDFSAAQYDRVLSFEELAAAGHLAKILPRGLCSLDVVWASALKESAPFVAVDDSDIEQLIFVNTHLLVLSLKRLARAAMKVGGGSFVFLSSVRVNQPTVGTSIYSSSKAFGETLFRSLAVEYGKFGLRFNSVRLGLTESGMSTHLSASERERLLDQSTIGRTVHLDEVWNALHFIFTNSALNGAVVELGGL